MFLPRQSAFNFDYSLGQRWNHIDIQAPFNYAINKSEKELRQETESITENISYYFYFDAPTTKQLINAYANKLNAYYDYDSIWKFVDRNRHQIIVNRSAQVLEKLLNRGILQNDQLKKQKVVDYMVYLNKNGIINEVYLNDFLTPKEAEKLLLDSTFQSKNTEAAFYLPFFEKYIQPNIIYNNELTQKAQREAVALISPSFGMVEKGETVIKKGDIITAEKFQLLESLKLEYESQTDYSQTDLKILLLAQLLLISVLVALLYLFIALMRPDILEDNLRITFIYLSIIIVIGLASLNERIEIFNFYLLPYCILPILVRVFYDTKLALFTHIIALIIAGLIVPNPFEFFIIEFIGGIACVFSIVNLRKRSRLFITIFLLFATYTLVYTASYLVLGGHYNQLKTSEFVWFASSAALTLFSYPLIYGIEKVFGFTSDISLLELSDTNNPLLKELALKAPGTFQHSQQVANLAETAIEKIGGNSLLARAGALYHDIGKMDTARYFTENQVTGFNPHDDIDNEESARIIINHVINGVKIAKKYRLPESVIDFIRTHHGTTMVKYFYSSELKDNPNQTIDETQYTYPGPIPYSKETAVVMMADGVEATSRSLKKVDSESIENLVDGTIDRLIREDQFINADITFKDITIIRKTFKKMLMNIFHVRIEYPK